MSADSLLFRVSRFICIRPRTQLSRHTESPQAGPLTELFILPRVYSACSAAHCRLEYKRSKGISPQADLEKRDFATVVQACCREELECLWRRVAFHIHTCWFVFSTESRQLRQWVEMKCTTGNQEQVAKLISGSTCSKNHQSLSIVAVGQSFYYKVIWLKVTSWTDMELWYYYSCHASHAKLNMCLILKVKKSEYATKSQETQPWCD